MAAKKISKHIYLVCGTWIKEGSIKDKNISIQYEYGCLKNKIVGLKQLNIAWYYIQLD